MIPDEPEAESEEPQPLATDETESAADPERLPKVRRKRKKHDDEAAKFWRSVLADEIGAREIWKLLQAAHTFEERFACGPSGFPQPEATWFHAGEQSFGMRLFLMLLRLDAHGVLAMQATAEAQPKPKPRED